MRLFWSKCLIRAFLTTLSNTFMRCDVRATGRKFFGNDRSPPLWTGQIRSSCWSVLMISLICNYKPLSRGLYDSILPLIILLWILHSVEFKHIGCRYQYLSGVGKQQFEALSLNLGIYIHYVYTPWSAVSTEVF